MGPPESITKASAAVAEWKPKFFAKVIGELLFWVGEDRMTVGGDYNIWTPMWQVEGFVDWQLPDDDAFSDYPRLTTASRKKILGLNAARLYDIAFLAGDLLRAIRRLKAP